MLLIKTARSSTLRLALVYVALFSASIFGLLAYVYWSTYSYLETNFERAVTRERTLLMESYDTGGQRNLIAIVARRIDDQRLTGWFYGLADASSRIIAGNLPQWPATAPETADWSGFTDFNTPPDAGKHGVMRVTYRTLSDGSRLLVGRRADMLRGFITRAAIALAAAAALFVILAAAAGISTARRSVTRIETINQISREIMLSGLGKRVPLRGTGDEWDELATNLNSMLDRIEALLETNRQVSDDVAHDLRTPLTRMRGRLERAAAEPLDPSDYQSVVNDTIAELDGILRMFSSLLRISRIEASDQAPFRRLDLNEIASEVVELFDAEAEERSVCLILSRDDPAVVLGDRDLLFDALSNLVDNAIKHGGIGDQVHIIVARTANATSLSIIDSGPGIPSPERQKVFKRFYRLEQSRNTPGNGLGLSLVAAVANLHGCRIEMADNAPGLRIDLHFPPVRERFTMHQMIDGTLK